MGRIVSRIVMMALAGCVICASAEANDRDRRIKLEPAADFKAAAGSARFRDRGSERELRVDIEDVRLPKGTELEIRIDGKLVGTLTLATGGSARFRARDRQTIPAVTANSKLIVQQKNGMPILTGVFR